MHSEHPDTPAIQLSNSHERSPAESMDAILQGYIDDLVAPVVSKQVASKKKADTTTQKEPAQALRSSIRKTAYEGLSDREALFVKRLQIAQSRSRFKRALQNKQDKLHCEVFVLNGYHLAIPSSAIAGVSRIGRVSAAVISTAHKVSSGSVDGRSGWAKKYQELRKILQKPLGGEKSDVDHEAHGADSGPLNPDDALLITEQGKSGLSVRLKGGDRFIFVERQLEKAVFDPMAIEFAEYELEEWSSELNGGLVGAAVDDHANLVYLFDPLQLDRIGDARFVLDED